MKKRKERLDVSPAAQGRRIGLLRERLRWPNKLLSEKTGIPEATLSQYVHAKKLSISALDLWRIAQATGVTVDWLISGSRSGLSATALQLLPSSENNLDA